MTDRRRFAVPLAVSTAVVLAFALAPRSQAQVPPVLPGSTTTTTGPQPTEEPSSPPSGADLAEGSSSAPAGAPDSQGDGAPAPVGGIEVPPEAQRIINSVVRSGSSSNSALIEQLARLRDLGLDDAEAYHVGLGRFPIAGPARYSHDWLFPRYGPGFRFHLGTDVFAAYGTPVRAPVDGVVRSANGGLGGLTVKVFMPDGTYFYLAHLSGLVDGFKEGMSVETGDIVGYVGDSGNARGGAAHLHIGIYPLGGPPIDPKPVLDQFLAEAEWRLAEVIMAYEAVRVSTPPTDQKVTVADERRQLRPMLATELLHPLASGGAGLPTEVLYLTGANPLGGARTILGLAVADLLSGVDWAARAAAEAG